MKCSSLLIFGFFLPALVFSQNEFVGSDPAINRKDCLYVDHTKKPLIDLQGEFLYWWQKQCDIDYVIETSDTNLTVITNGHFYNPEWKFNPGFRLSAAINTSPNLWKVEYTRFCSTSKDSKIADATHGLIPYNPITWLEFAACDSASVVFKLKYNVLDLIYKTPYVLDTIIIAPLAGFRGALIDEVEESFYQETDVIYWNAVDGAYNLVAVGDYTINAIEKRKYLGLNGGISFDYPLGQYFFISNTNLISVLYSSENITYEHRCPGFSPYSGTDIVVQLKHEKRSSIKVPMQTNIYINGRMPCGQKAVMTLGVGYEFNVWFQFLEYSVFSATLYLHGMNVRMALDF